MGIPRGAEWLVILLVLLVLSGVYLIPTIVAFARETSNRGVIFLVNLFLGGTGIGWVAALLMAVMSEPSGDGESV